MASPAAAVVTVTSQSALISLGNLDNTAINNALINFANFNSFALTGQHLTKVTLKVTSKIDGAVRATNNSGGPRNPTASYTLNTAADGMGFSLAGTDTKTQTFFNVPNGSFRVISQIDPSVLMTQSLTSGLSVFNVGPVQIAYDAAALLAKSPADVLFGAGTIVNAGSTALFTLEYESVIPEPATWALMIVGFGMVGVAARRRKAAVAA